MVAANRVPPVEVRPGTLEKLDEMQGSWQTRMSVEHGKKTLLQQLDLSGLEGWSSTNHATAHALLTEYHDIFLLEPGELGCTDLAKHEIWVVDCCLHKLDMKANTQYNNNTRSEVDCIQYYIFSNFILSCFCFCVK